MRTATTKGLFATFTQQDFTIIACVINCSGKGQHPAASSTNIFSLECFTLSYIIRCLKVAVTKDYSMYSVAGHKAINIILFKVNAYLSKNIF